MDKINKSEVDEADIEAGKKASIEAVASTNNNVDSGGKITDWHAGLTDLVFAALTTANCISDFNIVVPKKTFLGTATSTSDKFFTIFAIFPNTTLEKKPNMCESNPFLFVANY